MAKSNSFTKPCNSNWSSSWTVIIALKALKLYKLIHDRILVEALTTDTVECSKTLNSNNNFETSDSLSLSKAIFYERFKEFVNREMLQKAKFLIAKRLYNNTIISFRLIVYYLNSFAMVSANIADI